MTRSKLDEEAELDVKDPKWKHQRDTKTGASVQENARDKEDLLVDDEFIEVVPAVSVRHTILSIHHLF